MRDSTQLSLPVVETIDPRIPDDSVVERFWAKVDRSGGADACWLWTACKTSDGYGAWAYQHGGRIVQLRAHRFAFLIKHGGLTEGKVLHHLCEMPTCVRPDHLMELTPGEHVTITPGTYVHTNAGKTHCPAGHELSGENLMASALRRGQRSCRICANARSAAWRAANPEKFRSAVANYKAAHADEVRAKDREYRARQRVAAKSPSEVG